MDLILHIETSTTNCSVALSDGEKCIAVIEEDAGYSHAENLSVFIDGLFKLNGLSPDQLKAVAIGKGPGSYTGLRIGTSTAKGIAYGLNIPLLSVSSLETMIYDERIPATPSDALLIPMTDARRMEVYMAVFDREGNEVSKTEALVIDGRSFDGFGRPLLLFGSGAQKLTELFDSDEEVKIVPHILPSAKYMAKPVFRQFRIGNFEDTAYFEPFYLKDFVATKPKKRL